MIHGPPTSPLMRAAIVSVADDNMNFGGKRRSSDEEDVNMFAGGTYLDHGLMSIG
jgi:hypothetical protein